MNKLLLFCALGLAPLTAAEGDFYPSNFVNSLLNNQYLLESLRLTNLAEECYAEGEYDAAIRYAEEALRYADQSDRYVALQLKIKKTNDAIANAKKRLEWAAGIGAPKRYALEYEQAQFTYEASLAARSSEKWDTAYDDALLVLAILAGLREQPSLPAQYVVKYWDPMKDCLWNIAGKPQIYGDPEKWRVIYEANKHKFVEPNNPNLIEPGMILDIPSINGEVRSGVWEGDSEVLMR
ncbi:MAG: LysM peptidoglycan-binding domain-containing protein [Spirochaetaceae bacterium]|jgi:nucleoid-associated protein YgaU|nr:LysM peptidoglycan-binding domain-containing protein [Spirochaetaceae bacterium]